MIRKPGRVERIEALEFDPIEYAEVPQHGMGPTPRADPVEGVERNLEPKPSPFELVGVSAWDEVVFQHHNAAALCRQVPGCAQTPQTGPDHDGVCA